MSRYKLIVLFFFFSSLIGCIANPYQKTADGIFISLKNSSPEKGQTIRLQVVTNDIIRVTASPSKNLSNEQSLITTFSSTKKDGWKVSQQKNNVILETATTRVLVSIKTGEIKFTDLKENVILQEQRGGWKIIQTNRS